MKNRQRRIREYAAVLLFGFLFISAVFLIQGVPWNDRSLLLNDCAESYYQIYAWFRQVLAGERSLFFTFSFAGGTSTTGMLVYYLISPLNLLFFLIPESKLQLGMHLIIILNAVLSYFNTYILLRHEHPRRSLGILAALAMSYALCGWYLGYLFNILWLDAMYLLPLVTLGINRMIEGKSPWLYAVSLFLSVLTSYYIGFMICAFSLFYTAARVHAKKEAGSAQVRSWLQYWIITIGAGLATFILMVPALTTMTSSRMLKSLAVTFGFRGLRAYSKLFWGASDPKVLNSTYCYLYSGIYSVLCSLLYFLNGKADRREKIPYFLLWLFLVLSVVITPVYMLWHALSIPADFVGRFTFILSFYSAVLAGEYLEVREGTKLRDILIAGIIVLLFCAFHFLRRPEFLGRLPIAVTLILSCVYLFMCMPSKIPLRKKEILIVCITMAELFTNAWVVLGAFDKEIWSHIDSYGETMAENTRTDDTDGFYRTAVGHEFSPMSGVVADFNTSGMFMSSTANEMPQIGYNLGYPQVFNAYWYSDDTSEIADIFLNHRYVSHNYSNTLYEQVRTYTYDPTRFAATKREPEKRMLMKNPLTFGMGTMSTDTDVQPLADYNTLDYQNRLIKAVSGIDQDVLKQETLQKNGDYEFTYNARQEGEYYILVRLESTVRDFDIQIYQNDRLIRQYDPYEYLRICTYIRLPSSLGETKIRIETNGTAVLKADPLLYSMQKDTLTQAASAMQTYAMRDAEVRDSGYIRGTVTADAQHNVLFLSLPYQKGWSVKVDGTAAECFNLDDGFTGIRLSEGEHTVEMQYHTPGFIPGAVISLIGIACLLAWAFAAEKIESTVLGFYDSHASLCQGTWKAAKILFVLLLCAVYLIYPANARFRPVLAVLTVMITAAILYTNRSALQALLHRNSHKA